MSIYNQDNSETNSLTIHTHTKNRANWNAQRKAVENSTFNLVRISIPTKRFVKRNEYGSRSVFSNELEFELIMGLFTYARYIHIFHYIFRYLLGIHKLILYFISFL